ncbi:MAG: DUF6785 family protein, partial [Candidatus Bathyarchaeia archaeon]
MSMEKRIEVKVPWHIIIPTIIVCSILGTTTSLLTKGSLVWLFNLQTTLYVLNFTPTPYILLTIIFILAFYSNSIRQKINVHTLVFMYTAALIATSFSGVMIPWRNWGNFFTDRVADPDVYTSKLPLFWMPAYEFVLPSRLGGVAVPWGPWAPALGFWILFYIVVFLYQTSWASLLRRQWIDIDEVPFPYVLAQSALISSAKSGKSDKSRLTMIGILIGL